MTDKEILNVLKTDLQISAEAYDTLLASDIAEAREEIGREGIHLSDSIGDGMLVERYAAYLYRARREDTPMPRFLRYQLNNRIFSEKAKEQEEDYPWMG